MSIRKKKKQQRNTETNVHILPKDKIKRYVLLMTAFFLESCFPVFVLFDLMGESRLGVRHSLDELESPFSKTGSAELVIPSSGDLSRVVKLRGSSSAAFNTLLALQFHPKISAMRCGVGVLGGFP